MFGLSSGSAIIDFCIGMMFFFLILTLTCTMINEYLMDKLAKMRQKTLLEGIAGLFYDPQILEKFYKHPLITGLYDDDPKKGLWQRLRHLFDRHRQKSSSTAKGKSKTTSTDEGKTKTSLDEEPTIRDCVDHLKKKLKTIRKLPAYIPSRTFANALLDLVVQEAVNKKSAANAKDIFANYSDLRRAVEKIENKRIKGVLLPLIDAAPDLEKARENIEKWFDDTMDRVSGWFKRRARFWLLWIAFAICLVLNADSIMVGKILWQNDALRAAVVKQAESIIKESPKSGAGAGAQPASKPTDPATSPKADKQKSSGAEKVIKNPAAPATPETVKQKTGTEETKENDLGQKVQAEINKLQFPLGWVCPEKEKFDKMECKWLKFILSFFCKHPSPEQGTTAGQKTPAADQRTTVIPGTSLVPGKPAIKEAPASQGTTKDQSPKDQQKKKDNDKAKVATYDPRTVPTDSGDIYLKIMGLFFTTLAISFGAPFWTDLLNTFVNLRKTGKVPAKSGEVKK